MAAATGYFAQVNGNRAVSCALSIPLWGTWAADVKLATDASIGTGPATLVVGTLSFAGFIYRIYDFAGALGVRLVGGFGGWQKSLPSKAYSLSSGVPVSMILLDVAQECGETFSTQDVLGYATGTVGANFVRAIGPAQRLLRLLAPNGLWWIDPTGTTRLAPRTTTAISSTFETVKYTEGQGLWEIATENPDDWTPGRTFTSSTVPVQQTVGFTRLDVGNDGKLRMMVMAQ